MTDPSTSSTFGKSAAAWLCLLLLAGFAVITLSALRDRARLGTMEKMAEPTAVGETRFFRIPAAADAKTPVAVFENRPLFLAGLEKIKQSDSRMRKAGEDATRSFFVYQSADAKREETGFYFLKTAPGEYLKAAPAPGQ
jgi:hypothetical protein